MHAVQTGRTSSASSSARCPPRSCTAGQSGQHSQYPYLGGVVKTYSFIGRQLFLTKPDGTTFVKIIIIY